MTRICYVEDERDIAGVVSEYLEERGFQVSLCAGAQDAREALGKEEGGPRHPGLEHAGRGRDGSLPLDT